MVHAAPPPHGEASQLGTALNLGTTTLHKCAAIAEAGSYVRLIDSCITQLKAQGPSRTYNESKEEEEKKGVCRVVFCRQRHVHPPALETPQGQILSQSPTDAARFWWHLYGS